MKIICKLFFLFLILSIGAGKLYAAAYWLDVNGTGKVNEPVIIKLYYGSMNERGIRVPDTGKEFKLTGHYKLSLIDADGNKQPLKLNQAKDYWETSFTPTQKGVYRIIGIHETHPVIDRSASGGENVLPIDYLCAVYEVDVKAGADFPLLQNLDITTEDKGESTLIRVFANGKPAEKAKTLRIFNPENWEKELTLDAKGETILYPTMKGLYIIRQDWFENKPGELNGIAYTRIRHRCNYYLLVK